MEYVKLLDTDIDTDTLVNEVNNLIANYNLEHFPQISLTSIDGQNDWQCATGKLHLLKHPERYYSTVIDALSGTYIAECIQRYSAFYRWRLLRLDGRSTYSIHSDSNGNLQKNIRLHIPVITNPESFLCFYPKRPTSGNVVNVHYEHLKEGNSYVVDTTGLHSAVNYSTHTRYHIVGVRYENSNNRPQ